jgi:hypothetical protein
MDSAVATAEEEMSIKKSGPQIEAMEAQAMLEAGVATLRLAASTAAADTAQGYQPSLGQTDGESRKSIWI